MGVKATHPDYDRMLPKWERCRHVSEGQDAVHAHGEKYLPKLKDQTPAEYNAYVMRATFYNATWRTIAGLVGMVFRKPPVVKVPEAATELLEDVTLSGVPFQLFAHEVTEEAMKVGRVGILVDYPTVADPTAVTLADAKQQNLRPMIALYRAESITNWKMARVNNVWTLTQVVLKEDTFVFTDEFTSKVQCQYRVLDLVGGIYRVRVIIAKEDAPRDPVTNEAPKDDVLVSTTFPLMNGKNMNYIPFMFLSSDDNTQEIDDPPLLDLVNLNLSHYRTMADLEHGAHFTGLPTAWIAGFKPDNPNDKLYIGSQAAWIFPDPQAKAEYLEFKGEGLKTLQSMAEAKEKQMAVLGARMLEQQQKANVAFDTVQTHRKGEEAMLALTAQALSLGLTKVLEWYVAWAGIQISEAPKEVKDKQAKDADGDDDSDTVDVQLNRDFYPQQMTFQMLAALVQAWQQGAISYKTLFDNLQAGDVIDEADTPEDEQARIADQPPTLQGGGIDPATGQPYPPGGGQGGTPEEGGAARGKSTAPVGSPRGQQPSPSSAP